MLVLFTFFSGCKKSLIEQKESVINGEIVSVQEIVKWLSSYSISNPDFPKPLLNKAKYIDHNSQIYIRVPLENSDGFIVFFKKDKKTVASFVRPIFDKLSNEPLALELYDFEKVSFRVITYKGGKPDTRIVLSKIKKDDSSSNRGNVEKQSWFGEMLRCLLRFSIYRVDGPRGPDCYGLGFGTGGGDDNTGNLNGEPQSVYDQSQEYDLGALVTHMANLFGNNVGWSDFANLLALSGTTNVYTKAYNFANSIGISDPSVIQFIVNNSSGLYTSAFIDVFEVGIINHGYSQKVKDLSKAFVQKYYQGKINREDCIELFYNAVNSESIDNSLFVLDVVTELISSGKPSGEFLDENTFNRIIADHSYVFQGQQNPIFNEFAAAYAVYYALLKASDDRLPPHMRKGEKKLYYDAMMELLHVSLSTIGMMPVGGEIFDIIDGVVYVLQKDPINASISFASATVFGGVVPAAARLVKFKNKILFVKDANNHFQLAKNVNILKFMADNGLHYKDLCLKLGGGLQMISKTFTHASAHGGTITANRIMKGWSANKIAVIGRNMVDRVDPFANKLSNELGVPVLTWKGFNNQLSDIENIANNRAWIKSLKEQGYTFYDIGLDPKYTSGFANNGIPSFDSGPFYSMELEEIFN